MTVVTVEGLAWLPQPPSGGEAEFMNGPLKLPCEVHVLIWGRSQRQRAHRKAWRGCRNRSGSWLPTATVIAVRYLAS